MITEQGLLEGLDQINDKEQDFYVGLLFMTVALLTQKFQQMAEQGKHVEDVTVEDLIEVTLGAYAANQYDDDGEEGLLVVESWEERNEVISAESGQGREGRGHRGVRRRAGRGAGYGYHRCLL